VSLLSYRLVNQENVQRAFRLPPQNSTVPPVLGWEQEQYYPQIFEGVAASRPNWEPQSSIPLSAGGPIQLQGVRSRAFRDERVLLNPIDATADSIPLTVPSTPSVPQYTVDVTTDQTGPLPGQIIYRLTGISGHVPDAVLETGALIPAVPFSAPSSDPAKESCYQTLADQNDPRSTTEEPEQSVAKTGAESSGEKSVTKSPKPSGRSTGKPLLRSLSATAVVTFETEKTVKTEKECEQKFVSNSPPFLEERREPRDTEEETEEGEPKIEGPQKSKGQLQLQRVASERQRTRKKRRKKGPDRKSTGPSDGERQTTDDS